MDKSSIIMVLLVLGVFGLIILALFASVVYYLKEEVKANEEFKQRVKDVCSNECETQGYAYFADEFYTNNIDCWCKDKEGKSVQVY